MFCVFYCGLFGFMIFIVWGLSDCDLLFSVLFVCCFGLTCGFCLLVVALFTFWWFGVVIVGVFGVLAAGLVYLV